MFICQYEGHKQQGLEVSFICLDRYCHQQQRKLCSECLRLHSDHAFSNCILITFLKKIAKNERNRLQQLSSLKMINVQAKIQEYILEIEQIITYLKENQFFHMTEIIKILIKCYNNILQEELINLCYEYLKEENQQENIKNTVNIIQNTYSIDEKKYFFGKMIQKGIFSIQEAYILYELKEYEESFYISFQIIFNQPNQKNNPQNEVEYIFRSINNHTLISYMKNYIDKQIQNLIYISFKKY